MTQKIRKAEAVGDFYPADANELSSQINNYLGAVAAMAVGCPKAIMAPHAGYHYSGSVAAHCYKQLAGRQYRTVYLLSNSHIIYFDGIAIDDSDAWQTPLGLVLINKEKAQKLAAFSSDLALNSSSHLHDHTLEVQLPFLQSVLGNTFKIVPILFGNLQMDNYEKLAEALEMNFENDDLLVVSTDLSHYPSHDHAKEIDNKTLEMIKTGSIQALTEHIKETESLGVPGEHTLICGLDGVKTLMSLAEKLDWNKVEILKYANSGDLLGGDWARVVGYGAMIFGQDEGMGALSNNEALDSEQKKQLHEIVLKTVENYVKFCHIEDFQIADKRLNRHQGAFVSIYHDEQLRGCIGQIVATEKPLWQVVREMAIAAISEDPRFSPVKEKELEKLSYEISVLSAPARIDDWRKISLPRQGVIIRKGHHCGVFLPQVAAETGWSLEEYLEHLCEEKAGLPPTSYKDDPTVEISTFTAQVF